MSYAGNLVSDIEGNERKMISILYAVSESTGTGSPRVEWRLWEP
jgi:hypothetical protein